MNHEQRPPERGKMLARAMSLKVLEERTGDLEQSARDGNGAAAASEDLIDVGISEEVLYRKSADPAEVPRAFVETCFASLTSFRRSVLRIGTKLRSGLLWL